MEITNILTEAINNQTPISFSKYGDGEFFCANSCDGVNCDMDPYTFKKKKGLIESFQYMVNEVPNSYMGIWNYEKTQSDFWEGLTTKKIKWAKYHTIIMDNDNVDNKVSLYKSIKYSTMKKIYICNPLMIKAKLLLNIDYMVHVPFNNWFDSYFDELMNVLKKIIRKDEKYIIITSAGMGAKILICELSKLFPNNIYLDFGSAIDKICTKKTSRGWEPSYEVLMSLLKDLISQKDWNDPKYDIVYEEAKKKMGIHLGETIEANKSKIVKPLFNEDWYSQHQIDNLTSLLKSVSSLHGNIIEIGCWEGKSTINLANNCYPEILICNDTWLGNVNESIITGVEHITLKILKERDVYSIFIDNMNSQTQKNYKIVKEDCIAWLTNYDGFIKFIHIDASHEYESVLKTIELVLPKMVRGGIICGDDYLTSNINRHDLHGGVERAVKELLPNFKNINNLWYWFKE